MPEPTKTDPTTPVTSHETVVNTQVTTEAIDSNGKNLAPNTNLADIFSKIESGSKAEDAVKEVMDKSSKPKEESTTKEISVTSSHPEKKEEKTEEPKEDKAKPSNLEDALDDGQKKKDEPKQEEKKEEKKTEEEFVPEEELQVLPHDKPKTAKRISALLQKVAKADEIVATTKKERDERDAKLKEMETKLASVKTVDPKTEEEVQQKLNELSMLRRKYELDKDPELKSKYDDRIVASEGAIPDILKKNGAGDALVNLIKEEGGWQKFSQSNRLITLAGGDQVSAAELADKIVSQLPFADRKAVDAISIEQIQLKREKERYVEEQIKVADKFFKEREDQESRKRSDFDAQVKQGQEAINKWHKMVSEQNDFLKEKSIPSDATPEIKKALEEDNAHAKELNSVLKKHLGTKDLDGMLGMVLESVQYHAQRRETAKLLDKTKRLEAELKSKQEEIDNFKKSGKTTPKSGSLIGGGGNSSAAPAPKKPATIEDAFSAIESGRGLEE